MSRRGRLILFGTSAGVFGAILVWGLTGLPAFGGFDGDPAWWPGDRIAFVSTRSGNPEIWTVASNGSDLRRVTHRVGPDVEPAWSPE